MAEFELTILGCGSATPSMRHNPACQAIEHRGKLMLIDCGEGAQLSLRRWHVKFSRLTDVFISHLHGDHFLGLPGLLSTLSLHDKGGRVRVHIFREGAELLKQIMALVSHDLPFEIEYCIIDPALDTQVLFEDKGLTVTAFRLYHRNMPCVGFRFDEKPKPRHINGEMVRFLQIPVSMLPAIKEGADFVREDGTVIPNDRLTGPADPSGSYAYCSDTVFCPAVAEAVKGVKTLYHEATYAGPDMRTLARQRGHSTAAEAAEIARMAGAERLILGHYSKRYENEDIHLAEARAIFPNTIAADEGMRIEL